MDNAERPVSRAFNRCTSVDRIRHGVIFRQCRADEVAEAPPYLEQRQRNCAHRRIEADWLLQLALIRRPGRRRARSARPRDEPPRAATRSAHNAPTLHAERSEAEPRRPAKFTITLAIFSQSARRGVAIRGPPHRRRCRRWRDACSEYLTSPPPRRTFQGRNP